MTNTVLRYTFILIAIALILIYFRGAQGVITSGGSVAGNIIALLQGRRADGNGVIGYAE